MVSATSCRIRDYAALAGTRHRSRKSPDFGRVVVGIIQFTLLRRTRPKEDTLNATTVRISGPLADHKHGLWAHLRSLGYSTSSSANKLRVLAHLSRWLDERRIAPALITTCLLEEFLGDRRAAGYTCCFTLRALAPLVEYLGRRGVIPPLSAVPEPQTPLNMLLGDYERYLLEECALTIKTVARRKTVARQFLAPLLGESQDLGDVTAVDVTRFVVDAAHSLTPGSVGELASSLRALFRYLTFEGLTATDLTKAVPSVARGRLCGLPKALTSDAVDRMIGGCDRRTHVGRRDSAVLLLLARLGLRAGEVAGLLLDDFDWESAELLIRGKGGRQDLLPVACVVGEAVAAYLRRGRPRLSESRSVFLSVRAPHRPLCSSAVGQIVRAAGRRVGVAASAHQLRHTIATEMLGGGATLGEVSRVLRHQSIDTTAIYAKVDLTRLRDLARPWPGGAA
jgi:integrase/recombinase XerD